MINIVKEYFYMIDNIVAAPYLCDIHIAECY